MKQKKVDKDKGHKPNERLPAEPVSSDQSPNPQASENAQNSEELEMATAASIPQSDLTAPLNSTVSATEENVLNSTAEIGVQMDGFSPQTVTLPELSTLKEVSWPAKAATPKKKTYLKLEDVPPALNVEVPAEIQIELNSPSNADKSKIDNIIADIKAEDSVKQIRASLANISRQDSNLSEDGKSSIGREGVRALSAEAEFLEYSSKQTKALFNSLRGQTEMIEGNIAEGEKDVLQRDELEFLDFRHELAIAKLKEAHSGDYQKRKNALAATLIARKDRKKTKREARKSIRASKKRDQIIQQQERAAHAAARIRESITEKRIAFDALTQHLYTIHDKQRKNLIHSQERKFANEKLLVDLETRHLKVKLPNNRVKFEVHY